MMMDVSNEEIKVMSLCVKEVLLRKFTYIRSGMESMDTCFDYINSIDINIIVSLYSLY